MIPRRAGCKVATVAQKRGSLSEYGLGAARVRMAFGGVKVMRLDGEGGEGRTGRALCLCVAWGLGPTRQKTGLRPGSGLQPDSGLCFRVAGRWDADDVERA